MVDVFTILVKIDGCAEDGQLDTELMFTREGVVLCGIVITFES